MIRLSNLKNTVILHQIIAKMNLYLLYHNPLDISSYSWIILLKTGKPPRLFKKSYNHHKYLNIS